MSVLQTMVAVIKCALIHWVHINAAVIQDITKMGPNAQVCLGCVSCAKKANGVIIVASTKYEQPFRMCK